MVSSEFTLLAKCHNHINVPTKFVADCFHYETKLCILLFLFCSFIFFDHSDTILTCLKTCSWNPGTYRHKIVGISSAQFGHVKSRKGKYELASLRWLFTTLGQTLDENVSAKMSKWNLQKFPGSTALCAQGSIKSCGSL